MATYKLIGQRNLRKYTAARTSPNYAATADARLVVESLCDVTWEAVRARDATMAYHTEENVGTEENPVSGLDMNVRIRDELDAALFCADHSGGQHRAYANAAVYHYVLPDGALPKLTKLTASVTSDPYNAAGARIAILTNANGEIPKNCNDCRTGDAHADGVAPRTVAANGNWFPTMADCVFSATPGEGETALPSGGLQLQKHLFVFVLMESYSTVRGNWLEGCSFIRNRIEVELDAPVDGWSEDEVQDLSGPAEASAFPVLSGGILPGTPPGSMTGQVTAAVRTDASLLVEADHSQAPSRAADGGAAASAVSRLYARLLSGDVETVEADGTAFQPGAYFRVSRRSEAHVSAESDAPAPTDVLALEAQALVVPFVVPSTFAPARVRLSFPEPALSPGARFNVFLAPGYLLALASDQLRSPGLYDLAGPPFELLGTISGGTEATFAADLSGRRVATLVVTGYLPPEAYDLSAGGTQGTGDAPFMPEIDITD